MIDTFQISMIVGRSSIDLIRNGIEKELVFRRNVCSITNPLDVPGFKRLTITLLKNCSNYKLDVEISPEELLTQKPSIDLLECKAVSIEILRVRLTNVLEMIDIYFRLSNNKWYLSRIDYALQFKTSDVEMYTLLESKGPIPYRYEGLQKPGSTYNKCKSVRVNAYNKGNQLSKRNVSEELKREASELYRFECQCLELKDLKKKYCIDKSDLFGLFNEDISNEILKSRHKRHISSGDYFTRDEAAKRIMSIQGKQDKLKECMIAVLHFIEVAGSIPNAINKIRENCPSVPDRFRISCNGGDFNSSRIKFNTFLREHLSKVGINPVLLPSNYGVPYLKNSSEYLFID